LEPIGLFCVSVSSSHPDDDDGDDDLSHDPILSLGSVPLGRPDCRVFSCFASATICRTAKETFEKRCLQNIKSVSF
jgi:hypothetical protein